MRGKQIDMDMLRKKNELTPAVGNARVNARGDLLGPGGKIVKKREEVVKEYYKENPRAQKASKPAPTPSQAVETKVEKEVTFKKSSRTTAKSTQETTVTASEQAEFDAMDDGWVEDDEGNFVRKGE